VTGDTGVFVPWREGEESGRPVSVVPLHRRALSPRVTPRSRVGTSESRPPTDDADFDTYSLLFINLIWLAMSFFPQTSCMEEYAIPSVSTTFDYGTIVWAGLAILPLLFYPWRFLLPPFWKAIGYAGPGSGYRGLALLNGTLVVAFAVLEIVAGWRDNDVFVAGLLPAQQLQYHYNFLGAIADYVFFAVTSAVVVHRNDPRPEAWLTLLVLCLPPVGFPLFLAKVQTDALGKTLKSAGRKTIRTF
jgi:hypothetical protein